MYIRIKMYIYKELYLDMYMYSFMYLHKYNIYIYTFKLTVPFSFIPLVFSSAGPAKLSTWRGLSATCALCELYQGWDGSCRG